MEDFTTVATYYSLAEAEPPRLALEAAGIPTLATDENIGEMLVPTAFGGIKLQVASKDADRAKEVLASFKTDSQPETVDGDVSKSDSESDEEVYLTCSECGAEVGFPFERRGHVEVCPECGAYVDVPE
jgi:rubrerythrin